MFYDSTATRRARARRRLHPGGLIGESRLGRRRRQAPGVEALGSRGCGIADRSVGPKRRSGPVSPDGAAKQGAAYDARPAGTAADPRRRSGRPPRMSPARRYSLLQKNCLTRGSVRSRLIASKLGFEPAKRRRISPVRDIGPISSRRLRFRRTGPAPGRRAPSPEVAPGRETTRPGRRRGGFARALAGVCGHRPKRPPIGLRRFSFACNPLKNLNPRK